MPPRYTFPLRCDMPTIARNSLRWGIIWQRLSGTTFALDLKLCFIGRSSTCLSCPRFHQGGSGSSRAILGRSRGAESLPRGDQGPKVTIVRTGGCHQTGSRRGETVYCIHPILRVLHINDSGRRDTCKNMYKCGTRRYPRLG